MTNHVDDFITDYDTNPALLYAKWFLFLKRMPALEQAMFAEFIHPYKLFATWKEKRYRVTGASRMGDVWLSADFKREVGYEHRVELEELSEWGRIP